MFKSGFEQIVIHAGRMVLTGTVVEDAILVIEAGKIAAAGKSGEFELPENVPCFSFPDKIIAPGLIDIHIHGFTGVDVGQSNTAAQKVADSITQYGITGFLPTLSFAPSVEQLCQMLDSTASAIENQHTGAQMLGINFEAPFITRAGKGPYDRYPPAGLSAGAMAHDPSVDELALFADSARGHIKTMIIAPELNGALDVIYAMRVHGIIPSAGHTTASYEQIVDAIHAGLGLVTHLYNGMRRQDHREPGVIEAALTHDELVAEIVGDCVHVLPPALEIAIRCKGVDGLVLVTDNTKFAGMPNGVYEDDQGREVVKDDEKVHIPGWTLVGSVSPLNWNVGNIVHRLGHSWPEAFRMAALNPARLLSLQDRKGSLEPGKDADLIIIDEQINIHRTMIQGDWVYQRP